MSKIDEKYIKALDNFTDALGEIVKILKEQQKSNKADTVNEFLNAPMDNLIEVVKDLKKVTQRGFNDVKSDNQKILKKIESIKQQKESGMFDKIEDPRNKNKIVDGIKVVILIAAGVLALGMAFKLVGKVDFISVMAISAASLIISSTFSRISEFKNMKFSQIVKISAILPIMAASLALSAFFLQNLPTISFAQGLSLLFISGALGISAVLLLKSLEKIGLKSLLLVPLLPWILPFIAKGIVESSIILKDVERLSLGQVFSIALVGLAIGIAMYAVTIPLKHMKNITWKEMLMLPLMITITAWSIVKASHILSNVEEIKNPLKLVIDSLAIGLSILAFVPAVYILGKMKFKDLVSGILAIVPMTMVMKKSSIEFADFVPLKHPFGLIFSSLAIGLSILAFVPAVYVLGKMSLKDVATGVLAIPFIVAAIVTSAYILKGLPDDMKYPPFMWSLGVGLSILVFLPVAYVASLIDKKSLLQSALAIPILALTIVGVAYIFKLLPKEMIYPSIEWSLGVGLSILFFGVLSIGVGLLFTATAGVAAVGMALGLVAILAVALTIVETSKILNKGDYSKYPSFEWSKSVGLSLIAFSVASVVALGAGIARFLSGKDPLLPIAQSMVNVGNKLNEFDWTSAKYPSKEYTEGVGGLLIAFANG